MELKGKPLTLGTKILAVVIVLVGLVMKATVAPDLNIDDVIKSAAFAVLVFSPIDVSLWLENIFQKRSSRRFDQYDVPGGDV
jgi:hypothetical protein